MPQSLSRPRFGRVSVFHIDAPRTRETGAMARSHGGERSGGVQQRAVPDRGVGAATVVIWQFIPQPLRTLVRGGTGAKAPALGGGRALAGPLRGCSGQGGMVFQRSVKFEAGLMSISGTMKAGGAGRRDRYSARSVNRLSFSTKSSRSCSIV